MRSSLFALAASVALVSAQGQGPSAAPKPTIVASPGSLPLGANCADTAQCAGGAECFGSNFMAILQCGKFNAACTNDSQCATNTCNHGLCNGILDPSQYLSNKPTVAPGSIAVGSVCNSTAQCANGAQCAPSAAYQDGPTPKCGAFNTSCTNDSQCATNTCANGLCNGYKSSLPTIVPNSIPVGGACNLTEQCQNGAQCHVSAAYQDGPTPKCGAFNTSCTNDSQCATNTCVNNLCNGVKSTLPQVAPGSIAVGGYCNLTEQCANGAECHIGAEEKVGSKARCGSFNTTCTNDSQCAFNTCVNGLCNGYKSSLTTPATRNVNGINSTGTANTTATANATLVPFTGGAAATRYGMEAAFAIVLGTVAFLL